MTDAAWSLLIAEDEPAHAEAIRRAFECVTPDVAIEHVGTLRAYREVVAARPPGLALVDLCLPDGRAGEVLTWPPEAGAFPVVVMTSHGGEQVAVEAMKAGALDYVVKSPEALASMPRTVERALQEWKLRKECQRTEVERKTELERQQGFNLMTQSLLARAPIDSKLKSITESVVRLFDADFCRIWLIRPGDRCEQGCCHALVSEGPNACLNRACCLHLMATSGRYAHTDGKGHRRVPFGCYKIGRIASGKDHKLISNAVLGDSHALDREWSNAPGQASFAGYQLRAPGGETQGVMALFARHAITAAEDAMLDGLSSTVALVVRQAAAEAALRESEERHRALFERSRDALMLLAPPAWCFTSANPAAMGVFGAAGEADFVSRAPWQYSPERQPDGRASAEKAKEMIETAMREGFLVFEWTHQRLSGEAFPATVLLTRIDIEGQSLLQATVRDESERMHAEVAREKLEEQLRASQKMEAVGSLAGGIAHDFNNLLAVILSYTGFTLDAVRLGDPLRDDLLEIKKAGERAAALVRQLLAFGRKQILQPVPLDLNQAASGVEKMLRRVIGEDVELVLALAPALGLTLADPGQIEQVIMNLAINARDAMPAGGRLTIKTANVELNADQAARHVTASPGSYVQLAVTDSGCGMDAPTRERIFEPFFTTKERGKGTGLGLSTVYGVVSQSGGHILVSSEPGRGTTFEILLPRQRSATAPRPSRLTLQPGATAGTETILVVEDEQGVRNVAQRILAAAGYFVLVADGAAEALRVSFAHQGKIHLVLTDVVMPQMGGKEFADRLAQSRPETRILYMSGYADDAIGHRGVLDPGAQLIGKPFGAADLTRRVREVLDDHREHIPAAPNDFGRAQE